jgi:hypothetical protein
MRASQPSARKALLVGNPSNSIVFYQQMQQNILGYYISFAHSIKQKSGG